ncbi:hypothetical protein GF322_02085 [Candidatus Dependentiae bacterium]|nr:hypothetical protein [Candidatus Dependentiae bacterium]
MATIVYWSNIVFLQTIEAAVDVSQGIWCLQITQGNYALPTYFTNPMQAWNKKR